MIKFLTWDAKKRKQVLVGEINGKQLIKKVDPLKHFMRVVGGYGIQYEALVELKAKGITRVTIQEKGGKEWDSTIEDWFNNSSFADYGNGKQAFLSLKYMHSHNLLI